MKRKPRMFAISTCPRCKRVKQFMDSLGIDYEALDVDLLPGEQRDRVMEDLRKIIPVVSFPVILTEDKVLYGTDVDEVGRVFGGTR